MAVSKSEKGSVVSDLHTLLKSGEGADVTLVVGRSLLLAHSFILAARSPVFAAMFRNNMLEANSRRIEITDMQEAAVRQMLSFIYTDTAPQLASVAAELLAAGDKYDLPLLKRRCEARMSQDLSVENAAATATLAVLHRCPGLRGAAVQFIATHPEVMATDGWTRMLRANAEAAVQISKLVAAVPRPSPTEVMFRLSPTPVTEASQNRFVTKETRQEMATKLIDAARKGAAGEVWALLTAGAPKDSCDTDGNTALHLAANGGHATTVKSLLDLGVNVNAVNSSGQTPLHLAAYYGNIDVIWMLVAASARVNAQDNRGQTPLHMAVRRNPNIQCFVSVEKTLLLAGAREDIKDNYGNTPVREVPRFIKSRQIQIRM